MNTIFEMAECALRQFNQSSNAHVVMTCELGFMGTDRFEVRRACSYVRTALLEQLTSLPVHFSRCSENPDLGLWLGDDNLWYAGLWIGVIGQWRMDPLTNKIEINVRPARDCRFQYA